MNQKMKYERKIGRIKMKILDEIFILDAFDKIFLDEKQGLLFVFVFLSIKTKNTMTAKICSESSKQ